MGPLPLVVGGSGNCPGPAARRAGGQGALALGPLVRSLAEAAAAGEILAGQAAKLLPDHPKHLLVPGGEPQPGADPSSRWWSEKDRCGDRTHVLILLDGSDQTSVRHRRLSWSLRYLLPLTDASAIARKPFAIDDLSGLTAGILVAVFIYWGWDSTVTVNEER